MKQVKTSKEEISNPVENGEKLSPNGSKSVVDLQGSLRDFVLPIVEFLGILVPGVVFIFALIPAIIVPTVNVLRIIEGMQPKLPINSEYLLTIVLSPSVGTILLLAIFSYVFGHMFFRQDPKIPDQQSFKKVNKAEIFKEEGPVRMCEAEIEYNKTKKPKIPADEHNLEFPYRYLHEYLNDRGMKHLADIVPWEGNNPKSYSKRTKHFINVIKVRLEFLFPYQFLRIQRNEAHVRLMSSIWYASKSLISASIIGCIIGVLCIVAHMYVSKSSWPIPYIGSLVLPVSVLALAVYSKRNIESFLHYQRIREVVFILEAAYFAKKIKPEYDFYEQSLVIQNKN
ncbi:MAG: hypothetical protein FP816_21365 [Desulfobacteraceae bacterium]|nr:hypothetical protein [Desulfobacteraceae bacterium]